MVFLVVMYRCDSWTLKKAEHRRIDAFELWCCRRLLRVPWTARGSNQSILKESSPGFSLEGLMLKLKLQYFDHLMRRADSFEKILMLRYRRQEEKGMTEDEMVRWHHQLNGHGFESWWWTGRPVFCDSWGQKESYTTEWLNWTEPIWWFEKNTAGGRARTRVWDRILMWDVPPAHPIHWVDQSLGKCYYVPSAFPRLSGGDAHKNHKWSLLRRAHCKVCSELLTRVSPRLQAESKEAERSLFFPWAKASHTEGHSSPAGI